MREEVFRQHIGLIGIVTEMRYLRLMKLVQLQMA